MRSLMILKNLKNNFEKILKNFKEKFLRRNVDEKIVG